MKKLYSVIIVVLISLTNSLFASANQAPVFNFDTIKNAIETRRYQRALDELLPMSKEKLDNANMQYLIGLCYFNLTQEKQNAIPYFEKASQKINKDYKFTESEISAPPVTILYLAKSYHSSLQFDKAIEFYNKYKPLINTKDGITPLEIERNIEMCASGIEIVKNPLTNISSKNITANNLQNSTEILLYLSPDKLWFLYTTTTDNNLYSSNSTINNNLYICYRSKTEDKWEAPVKIEASLNASDLSTSATSAQIIYTQLDKKIINLYFSYCLSGKLTKPIKFDLPINNEKSSQSGACISEDGTTLYFASNREGGYGGFDIYKSLKTSSGKWGTPQNLGPQINTSSDESCPYILSDGVTLYFSSRGHNSMGGYDIFIATQSEEGFWGKAENVGYPINSPDDDIFYFLSSDEKNAFFSSSRIGTMGGGDLFQVTFN